MATALLAASAGTQEPPQFHAEVRAVFVDAFVSRDGAPVLGLSAADFEVFDEGVRQEARLLGRDEAPLGAALVFDASGSVGGEKLAQLRAAGHAFMDRLRPRDLATVVSFSHRLQRLVPYTTDRAALRSGLDTVKGEGGTSAFDALYSALRTPPRAGRPVVVLFTDGEDNTSWLGEEPARLAALEQSALVYVVAIEPPASLSGGGGTLPPESPWLAPLRRIAESTGGRLWTAGTAAGLTRAFTRILDDVATRYVLVYEPTGVQPDGWHRLKVRLKGVKGEVRTRSGYSVPAAPR